MNRRTRGTMNKQNTSEQKMESDGVETMWMWSEENGYR